MYSEESVTQTREGPFVHLLLISGPYRKREFVAEAPGISIGSSPHNDVVLSAARGHRQQLPRGPTTL